MMAAEQRHHGRAVLGDGQHGWLGALVGQQRRHGADQDAGGADADDGLAGSEAFGDTSGSAGPAQIAGLGTRQTAGEAFGQAQPRLGQREDGDPFRPDAHRQASPRLCTRIIEKYGTWAGSTASSGSRR